MPVSSDSVLSGTKCRHNAHLGRKYRRTACNSTRSSPRFLNSSPTPWQNLPYRRHTFCTSSSSRHATSTTSTSASALTDKAAPKGAFHGSGSRMAPTRAGINLCVQQTRVSRVVLSSSPPANCTSPGGTEEGRWYRWRGETRGAYRAQTAPTVSTATITAKKASTSHTASASLWRCRQVNRHGTRGVPAHASLATS